MVRAQNAAEKVWRMESGEKRSFLGCGNQLKRNKWLFRRRHVINPPWTDSSSY